MKLLFLACMALVAFGGATTTTSPSKAPPTFVRLFHTVYALKNELVRVKINGDFWNPIAGVESSQQGLDWRDYTSYRAIAPGEYDCELEVDGKAILSSKLAVPNAEECGAATGVTPAITFVVFTDSKGDNTVTTVGDANRCPKFTMAVESPDALSAYIRYASWVAYEGDEKSTIQLGEGPATKKFQVELGFATNYLSVSSGITYSAFLEETETIRTAHFYVSPGEYATVNLVGDPKDTLLTTELVVLYDRPSDARFRFIHANTQVKEVEVDVYFAYAADAQTVKVSPSAGVSFGSPTQYVDIEHEDFMDVTLYIVPKGKDTKDAVFETTVKEVRTGTTYSLVVANITTPINVIEDRLGLDYTYDNIDTVNVRVGLLCDRPNVVEARFNPYNGTGTEAKATTASGLVSRYQPITVTKTQQYSVDFYDTNGIHISGNNFMVQPNPVFGGASYTFWLLEDSGAFAVIQTLEANSP